MSKSKIVWLREPADKDYPAAKSYLSLLFNPSTVREMVQELRDAPMSAFYAKDILRASGLLLDRVKEDNHHVKKTLFKISQGFALSPVLLVRHRDKGLIVADGFHRVCGVYLYSEDAEIPCKIV